jgi:hypothetical protein
MLTSDRGQTLQNDVVEMISGGHAKVNLFDAKNEIAKLMANCFSRNQIENLSGLLVRLITKINSKHMPQAEISSLQDLVASVVFCEQRLAI